MLSKRQIAKFATRGIVTSAVAQASNKTMTTVIDPDTDFCEKNIETGSSIIGYVVSLKLRPYTDAAVDRVADWHINRKNANTPE